MNTPTNDRHYTPRRYASQSPWPDSLSQIAADLATTVTRLDGLTTALEAIGHKGEAAAAYHVSLQVRSLRGRVDRIQAWTGL